MDVTVTNSLTTALSGFGSLKTAANAYPQGQAAAGSNSSATNVNRRIPATTDQTAAPGTRVIAETRQELDNGGYRITRTYQREDGRTFSKLEDFTLTARGSRKTVVQQTPSGAITQYEEVLDREESGSFRRTQRFTDESGEVSTVITPNHTVTNPHILTAGQAQGFETTDPFSSFRGTQLDLSA